MAEAVLQLLMESDVEGKIQPDVDKLSSRTGGMLSAVVSDAAVLNTRRARICVA